MRTTKRIVVLALALLLALSATAFAQSAGDEQYVDPFQNPGQADGRNGSAPQGGDDQTQSAPTDDTQSGAAVENTTAADETASAGGDGVALPHTGLPLVPLVVGGALLLVGGATLRRRA